MDERLSAAQAALNAGRADEAIELLQAAITQTPKQPLSVYSALTVQLYRAGRHADGETWARRGLEHHPRAIDLMNLLGVFLRRQGRLDEAVNVLTAALRLQPKNTQVLSNLGNVHMDREDGAAAEAVTQQLLRIEPKVSEHHRLLGRALSKQGKLPAAIQRYRQSVLLNRANAAAWIDLVGLLIDTGRFAEAEDTLDRGIAAAPAVRAKEPEARLFILSRQGRMDEAEAFLTGLLDREETAWAHSHLAKLILDTDRPRALEHLRRAVALEPDNTEYVLSLAENVQRSRHGDEGAHIEEAYQIVRGLPHLGGLSPRNRKSVSEILLRVADYGRLAELGSFRELCEMWARIGLHSGLMTQIARVRTPQDRRDLVAFHRQWGQREIASAQSSPVTRPPPATGRSKLRIGFMSSDLRMHPVGYFALPLIQHYDRSRFDLYCYSFYRGEADGAQKFIEEQVDVFRWKPWIPAPEAAQMIADDQLDILIELGGSTHMNKLEVMAYKPAPLQASWLGYAHSAGPETIDYLVIDPYMLPKDPALLIEQPLMLPNCWYSTGAGAFREEPAVDPVAPVERNGFVTFGTANNPYKYNAEMVRSWARIVARTPNSQFLFIRPESGTPSFRENIAALFAEEGVSADRLRFEAVRGKHMPFYNQLDMSLDAFPQTGGTTTCESLWMGAPVVTLVGEALYERLSYSVLMNVGLEELCAHTVEQYEDIAVGLAADPQRIGELRRTLRQRVKDSPIGRTEQWAADFFDAVAKAVESRR